MVYVRGHPSDFDNWEQLGAEGWNYQNVLPYFCRAENWQGGNKNSPYRGVDGPLHVKFGDNAANTSLFGAFIKAGDEAGYGITDDYNASRQEGFGQMAMTVFHSGPNKGMRCSVASSYLHPTLKTHGDNLAVQTNAYTQRLLFDSSRSDVAPKAIGVEYLDATTGESNQIMASKEVIVCAGSIQTPQLLQVSGIGDQIHLESIDVETVCHNPSVGQNLQDHLELYFQQEVKPPVSMAPVLSNPMRQLSIGLEWILTRTGLGATNHSESCAFVRSSSKKTYPDVQFHFLPVGVSYDGVTLADSKTGHSMQIHIGTCRSKSRGHVRALTNDMKSAPSIKFNYMSHEEDWEDMRNAIEVARQVMRQPSMQIAGDEIMPGKDADLDGEYLKQCVATISQ
jgi:choline dehydrogenase